MSIAGQPREFEVDDGDIAGDWAGDIVQREKDWFEKDYAVVRFGKWAHVSRSG
jgi:hypothetical protein